MSKTLEASCIAGVVTAEGIPVITAEILSEGIAASEGVLILDEDEAFYLAKTSPDLKSTLTKLASALEKISSALTSLNTAVLVTTCPAGAGTAGPALVATADILQINAAVIEINLFKEALK